MIAESLTHTLSPDILTSLEHQLQQNPSMADALNITALFDARGMACPMPLLKAKVTLRQVGAGESLYLLASDKNSQSDLLAYCQKNDLMVHTWTSETDAMIFHFLIGKP